MAASPFTLEHVKANANSTMNKLAAALAAMTALVFAVLTWAGDPPQNPAALQRLLASRFENDRSGACVLAAVLDKERTTRALYCAGTRQDAPPAMDAAMEIGSVTKTMTAFLVADLMERQVWSLDDPIAKHLPAGTVVPQQGERQILVRDLLTHSSGLPALPPGMAVSDPANPYAKLTETQLLDALGRVQLQRPIGSQVEYSNFGMMLVSLAVARSDGGNYETALRDRLLRPLGMQAYVSEPGSARLAQGHLAGGRRTAAWTLTPNLAGVGMVHASLADMERYARAALGEGPAPVVALLRTTQQPLAHGFGMNWMRRSIQGRELVMHEGATGGFSSLVALEPAAHRAVVLLSDTELVNLGGLGDIGLASLGIEVPVQTPRRALAASAHLQDALIGDYQLGPMTLRIWRADEKLMAQASGQSAFELHHDSRGDFYPEGFAALLTPLLDGTEGNAPVQRFAWRQGGGVTEARRVGAAPAAPAISNPAWRDWAGEYQLAPQFSLRVFERDGRLMVQGTGQPAIEVQVAGKDRIEIRQVGAVVEFERNAAGQVTTAVLQQKGQTLQGPRR